MPRIITAGRTPAILPPLRDRIRPGVRVLFVGINPGVRSALTGHHFAGFSNRFWKLLYESGLVPEPIGYQDDDRLPERFRKLLGEQARGEVGAAAGGKRTDEPDLLRWILLGQRRGQHCGERERGGAGLDQG